MELKSILDVCFRYVTRSTTRIQQCPSTKAEWSFRATKCPTTRPPTAVFQDIGSSACLLTASKIVDTVAAAPGNYGEQSDAPQAYTQAELQGIETWIELPRDQWPETWKKFRRPVCMLRLALYGHPMSGVYWELHCNQRLKKKGFGAIPGWEQCFWHAELKLLLIVYVDDFKMAGPKENLEKGWKLISEEIKLDKPTPYAILGVRPLVWHGETIGGPKEY